MKKICVKPANEIEILFNDRAYTATFNMEAVMYMQEELGKSRLENISYQHFAAITLYSGIKVNHKDFEMEEAVALVMTMRPADVNEIVDEYTHSVKGVSVTENEEQLKKVIAQIFGNVISK